MYRALGLLPLSLLALLGCVSSCTWARLCWWCRHYWERTQATRGCCQCGQVWQAQRGAQQALPLAQQVACEA